MLTIEVSLSTVHVIDIFADMARHLMKMLFLYSRDDAEVAADVDRWSSPILARTRPQLPCTPTQWPS